MAYIQEKKNFSIEIDPKMTLLMNLENKNLKAGIIDVVKDLKEIVDIMSEKIGNLSSKMKTVKRSTK